MSILPSKVSSNAWLWLASIRHVSIVLRVNGSSQTDDTKYQQLKDTAEWIQKKVTKELMSVMIPELSHEKSSPTLLFFLKPKKSHQYRLNYQFTTDPSNSFSSILPIPTMGEALITDQSVHLQFKSSPAVEPNTYVRELTFPSSFLAMNENIHECFQTNDYHPSRRFPNIFTSNTNKDPSFIRFTPTAIPCIILYSPTFDQLLQELSDINNPASSIPYEMIAGNHIFPNQSLGDLSAQIENKECQIQFLSFYQLGVDLRITNCPEMTSSFVESSQTILAQTVPELRSARLLGGDATIRETKYGYAGDCWSEARTVTKYRFHSLLSTAIARLPMFQHWQQRKQQQDQQQALIRNLWKKGGPSMKE